MIKSKIRIHYQQNYIVSDYPSKFDALVELSAKKFEYELNSNAIHYHFVLFNELKSVPIDKESYNKYPFDSIMEILITNDFDEKIEVDDHEEDTEPTQEFSCKLLTQQNNYKAVEIGKSYTFFIKIKNNGKLAWPLPLTLSPRLNSTVFCADYPLATEIQPKEIAVFRINLNELDKKPIGEYTLNLQLKKGKTEIGPEMEFKFKKMA